MAAWGRREWTEGDLIGGDPVLDFLNTAGGGTRLRDAERLADFAGFLEWSVVAGILSGPEADALSDAAQETPVEADTALAAARAFREALHACLMAELSGMAWPRRGEAMVMDAIRDCLAKARFDKNGHRYGWSVPATRPDMSIPLLRIILATEDLLRRDDLTRLRNCDRCSWLFIDRGRGKARRWCSMSTCGSRAKSARYYRRKTARAS
ncbi:MAG: CGNR zinc finger domain-containing protein [Pseudomonadota bacterium]